MLYETVREWGGPWRLAQGGGRRSRWSCTRPRTSTGNERTLRRRAAAAFARSRRSQVAAAFTLPPCLKLATVFTQPPCLKLATVVAQAPCLTLAAFAQPMRCRVTSVSFERTCRGSDAVADGVEDHTLQLGDARMRARRDHHDVGDRLGPLRHGLHAETIHPPAVMSVWGARPWHSANVDPTYRLDDGDALSEVDRVDEVALGQDDLVLDGEPACPQKTVR